MKSGESMRDVSLLNDLHRTCLQMRRIPRFNEPMDTKTTPEYVAMKKDIMKDLRTKNR